MGMKGQIQPFDIDKEKNMGFIRDAAKGAIGTALQCGVLASAGTTVGIAVGLSVATKIVGRAKEVVHGTTTFEKIPSLRQAVSLGIVAADRAFDAGFKAFDRFATRKLSPQSGGGQVSIAEADIDAPNMDAILIGLHGADHEQAVRMAVDVAKHGSEAQVTHLLLKMVGSVDQSGLDEIYAAIKQRLGQLPPDLMALTTRSSLA